MIRRLLSIKNEADEPIHFDLRYHEGASQAPVVILLHGFMSSKDWGFIPDLARTLIRSDYVTVALNFSRNGIGRDGKSFTALEKFAENTISQELSDVRAVVRAIRNGSIGKQVIDPERIGIFGHSRGGGIAVLSALEMPEEIGAVVTWSAVSRFGRFTEDELEQLKTQGFVEVETTNNKFRINRSFLDDLQQNQEKFDLVRRIEDLESPILFIHGGADSFVPPAESEELYENCGSASKRLEIIEEADHTFGIRHPFEVGTEAYNIAKDLTESWFDRHLKY